MESRKQGESHLESLENTLRKNRASNYTESLTRLHQGFEYAAHADTLWHAESMSLMAGSPLFAHASASQRLALNHLWWCAFYEGVSGLETNTILFNELCANTFFRMGGYDTVCHELDLETSQERYHIEAFKHICRKTERSLLGFTLFTNAESAGLTGTSERLVRSMAPLARAGNGVLTALFYSQLSSSPFLASQYFLIRGVFNFLAKHRETLAFQRHKELEAAGASVPVPMAIIHYHYLDEAFHTASSQLIAHELYRDLPKPSAGEKLTMNLVVRGVLKQVLSHMGSLMAGSLGDDGIALPHCYRILRSRLFRMSHREALDMLEKCFCHEHEGFHQSAQLRDKFNRAIRRSLSDIDYLWPSNRELKYLDDVTLDRVLAKNRVRFQHFARTQRDEATVLA